MPEIYPGSASDREPVPGKRRSHLGVSAMKKTVLVAILLIAPAIVSAQNQTRERRSIKSETVDTSAARDRTVSAKELNHANNQSPAPVVTVDSAVSSASSRIISQPAWGNSPIGASATDPIKPVASQVGTNGSASSNDQAKALVKPTLLSTAAPINTSRTPNSLRDSVSASTYAVGIGDVLDVRLSNLNTRESTLFTVMKDGTLEYPLVGNPVRVVGMTTDDIARMLATQIKVLNAPRVSVSVRDYASHAVVVTGAIGNPGRKILRREAVPLFAILAESMVRPEAALAIITHNGKQGAPINLKDEQAMGTSVVSGDLIQISGSGSEPAKKFVYISGNVGAPGERAFREGMTLTQAIIAAGGVTRSTKSTVKVSRQNQSGFLTTSEFDLNAIGDGKAPDPQLQAGDRIEVSPKM